MQETVIDELHRDLLHTFHLFSESTTKKNHIKKIVFPGWLVDWFENRHELFFFCTQSHGMTNDVNL